MLFCHLIFSLVSSTLHILYCLVVVFLFFCFFSGGLQDPEPQYFSENNLRSHEKQNKEKQKLVGTTQVLKNTTRISQNHRMARVERDLKNHESPTPQPQAGPPTFIFSTRPGCPGPNPVWP